MERPPVARRKPANSTLLPTTLQDRQHEHKTKKTSIIRTNKQKYVLVAIALGAFVLGYYAQLLVFFMHVRMGFTGYALPAKKQSLTTIHESTRHILFVSNGTNWDYVGLVAATPGVTLFAHESVFIPTGLQQLLPVVRHEGVDSYLNLHNKTLSIMHHVAKTHGQHLLKQDDDAIVYWPHYAECLAQCHSLDNCYAGDMHVNIGDASNANSYVFATGGSYFVGSQLLQCLVSHPTYVELDGLDFGEDKTVGKMLHFNKCGAQYVSCKWFNNKEIATSTTLVRMQKGFSNEIKTDMTLVGTEGGREEDN